MVNKFNGICMHETVCLIRDGVLEKDKEKNYSAIKEQSETSASGPCKTLQ